LIRLPGLLLGQAVQRPEAKHQINRMDANYRTVLEHFA